MEEPPQQKGLLTEVLLKDPVQVVQQSTASQKAAVCTTAIWNSSKTLVRLIEKLIKLQSQMPDSMLDVGKRP